MPALPAPPDRPLTLDGASPTADALNSQPLPPPTAESYARIKALFEAVLDLDDARLVQARLP